MREVRNVSDFTMQRFGADLVLKNGTHPFERLLPSLLRRHCAVGRGNDLAPDARLPASWAVCLRDGIGQHLADGVPTDAGLTHDLSDRNTHAENPVPHIH